MSTELIKVWKDPMNFRTYIRFDWVCVSYNSSDLFAWPAGSEPPTEEFVKLQTHYVNGTLSISDELFQNPSYASQYILGQFADYLNGKGIECEHCVRRVEKFLDKQLSTDTNIKPWGSYQIEHVKNSNSSAAGMLSAMASRLPGATSLFVKYPCECYVSESLDMLRSVIIHLNDSHKWTREQIADWLDSVDDPENGIDLAFKVPEKEKS